MTTMEQNKSGLWVPPRFAINRMHPKVRTITLPDGRRAKITLDATKTVRHTETDEQLDCLVRPETIVVKVRRQ